MPLVTLARGLAGVHAVRDEWHRLTVSDGRYWMQYSFAEESLRHSPLGTDNLLTVVCRDRHGVARAILPLRLVPLQIRRVRVRGIELVGSTFDSVSHQASSTDFPADSVESAIRVLRATRDALLRLRPMPSLLLLGRLGADSVALNAGIQSGSLLLAPEESGGAKTIAVDRPFAALQSELSGKFRISLRSSRRNLHALGDVQFGTARRSDADFTARFAEFLRIEASGWKGQSGLCSGLLADPMQNQREFFEAIAARADVGDIEIHWLTLNGRCIASQLWLRHQRTRVAFKIGYLEEYARYQPGHLLTEHVLRQSCEDPVLREIDFVSDAAWLDKWRARVSPHYYCYLPISRLHGALAGLMLRTPTAEQIRHALARVLPQRAPTNLSSPASSSSAKNPSARTAPDSSCS
jgi:CelD/BcsL family acetyltransferase involved in cellulose biosynthesis